MEAVSRGHQPPALHRSGHGYEEAEERRQGGNYEGHGLELTGPGGHSLRSDSDDSIPKDPVYCGTRPLLCWRLSCLLIIRSASAGRRCHRVVLHMQSLPTVRAFAATATQATAFACEFAQEPALHELFGVPEDTVCCRVSAVPSWIQLSQDVYACCMYMHEL